MPGDFFRQAGAWFAGRRALVIGLGKSGAAAARLLHKLGAAVTAGDANAEAAAKPVLPGGVRRETGHQFLSERWELVVPSPGVGADIWRPLAQRGSLVWGELELAYRVLGLLGRWPKDNAAVTGTNGKTTTAALLGAMARADGRKTFVAGNIGTPLSDLVEKISPADTLILEVSSYQLETAQAFRPKVGAVLNLTPDHLGRHGTMANYARAKFRLFQSQSPEDAAVLNRRDAWCRREAGTVPSRVVWFNGSGVRWNGRRILSALASGGEWPAPRNLPGIHNVENAQAAVACARLLGISKAAVARALAEFPGVEHRLEAAGTRGGVRYVNDSKATNVDSTLVALKSFSGGLHLILGGQDKGAPYAPLRREIERKVREVLLIGEAAEKISRELAGAAPMENCLRLEAAVDRAAAQARPGETVLLSPACASFDQYENFEHRGRRFKELVKALRP